jgi:VCBS repeat-containing protein
VSAAAVEYLAKDQTRVESFTITINDQNGSIITKQIDVTITGTNDAPIVAAVDVTGAVTEMITPAGNLTDSGTIAFTDVDLTDVHLVSLTGTYVGPGTALGTLTAVKNTDTTGTGLNGQLTWTYTVSAAAVEYLAKDQTRVESFTITINDQNGSIITKQIDVTITGTNDAPIVAAVDVTGAVTEMITPAGNLTDSGTIAFTDVDLTDVHLVSLTGTYVGPGTALGTLTAVKNTDTTGTGSMGS